MTDGAPSLWRLQLEVRSGPDAGKSCVVDRDVVTVGKMEDCDLVLRDATVSRRHLRIARQPDGSWRITDLDSTNGTKVRGARIREAELQAGAVFEAGQVEIAFVPLREEVEVEPWPEDRFGSLIGRSKSMKMMFGLLARIAETDATVLLEGETGTGKGQVARAIHEASRRSERGFVVVDCGSVQRTLIESELFGHEKGAFSGAYQQRRGAFEFADRGTVFIDELGELDLDLQPRLLRVLDAREVRRVGAQQSIPVDIRVIAASRRDLQREVERGAFREDLFFRLSVVTIRIPPLRDRPEDIPILAEHFLSEAAKARNVSAPSLDSRTLDRLTSHDWPGNVRELKNTVERALYLSAVRPGSALQVDGLTTDARPKSGGRSSAFDPSASFQQEKERWLEDRERRYLSWLLERHEGNVSGAARAARMDRKYLHKLSKKYEL
ncbi:MAG: sigma 54-interacting transcriptional regulator [Myxococcota bacterium]